MEKEIAKTLWLYSQKRLEAGEVPRMLGLNGILALIYDKIRRFNQTMDKDEIMELASDALFALEIVIQAESPREGGTYRRGERSAPSIEVDDGIVNNTTIENVNEDETVPEEFKNWQTDIKQATALHNWLTETSQLELLDKKMQKKLQEAMK